MIIVLSGDISSNSGCSKSRRMKRFFTSKKGTSLSNKNKENKNRSDYNIGVKLNRVIEWELRPGGLLVQKREICDTSSGSGHIIKINIKVSHGSYHHDITIPAHCTFGDLKGALAIETGLQPKEQRLLFRGKEKEDQECLDMSGVKELSKVVLLEDPASKERKLEAMKKNRGLSRAYDAVAQVRAEVDKLSQKVVAVETVMHGGIDRVAEDELYVLTESLMTQLLKLDTIETDGESRAQRRIEVRRVQSLVDLLDSLRERSSSTAIGDTNGEVSVSTKWETFESGLGSLCAPKPPIQSATKITHHWELFD